MPSPPHETFVAFLAQRPDVLNLVLTALGHLPVADNVMVRDATLRVANPLEVRPDLVLLGEGERGPWVVVEVQLGRDETKQRRWLSAAGVLLDTRGAMGDVVVLTHDASVGQWARDVARVMGPGGTRLWLEPVVVQLTLAEVERLLATASPELAVVAAWAVHDQRGRNAEAVVEAAIACIQHAEDGLRPVLLRAMLSMLGDPLVEVVREVMMNPAAIPESPAYAALRRDLEAIGEARGHVRGEAESLLLVLQARGLVVDAVTRSRVEACTDGEVIRSWMVRAATASSLAEVFGE